MNSGQIVASFWVVAYSTDRDRLADANLSPNVHRAHKYCNNMQRVRPLHKA